MSIGLSRRLMLLAGVVLTAPHQARGQAMSDKSLDLSRYEITFDEEFHRLSISPHGPNTTWIAHTPWNGDFGNAEFVNPRPGFPFVLMQRGGLRIEARKGKDGKWRSGLICSRDADGPNGRGFVQQYGYFEMRAKLPPGPGTWPAFWLIGIDKQHSSAEIDVMEQYGAFPDIYHAGVHIWRKKGASEAIGHAVKSSPGLLTKRFNDYGVAIGPRWIRFYFNRREVWQTPTARQFRQPFYILADLALGGGWPIANTPNPSFMYIKYIRAYRKRVEGSQ